MLVLNFSYANSMLLFVTRTTEHNWREQQENNNDNNDNKNVEKW